jgi:hypothetical protein
MVELLLPASPPAFALPAPAVLVTLPVAWLDATEPPAAPTRPPTVDADVVTAPDDELASMLLPELRTPTRPPADWPTAVTTTDELELVTVAPLATAPTWPISPPDAEPAAETEPDAVTLVMSAL